MFGRAPLFEVQTDAWECFCAIHWDPSHADCAVPQVRYILTLQIIVFQELYIRGGIVGGQWNFKEKLSCTYLVIIVLEFVNLKSKLWIFVSTYLLSKFSPIYKIILPSIVWFCNPTKACVNFILDYWWLENYYYYFFNLNWILSDLYALTYTILLLACMSLLQRHEFRTCDTK